MYRGLPGTLPRLIRFGVVRADRLLLEYASKPSFSLGLQSFLELLLHKIRVPCMSHGVHEIDAVSDKQLDETVINGMHAVRMSDLNQARYLRETPIPNTRRHATSRRAR